ncbi:MAG: type II secretion system F family protein [Phycisphaerales bacterium]
MPPLSPEHIVVGILVFAAVVCIGAAFLVLSASRRRALRPRLFEDGVASFPVEGEGAVGLLSRVGGKASMGRPSEQLQTALARAGFTGRAAAEIYLGSKMLLLVVGVLAGGLLLVPADLSVAVKVLLALAVGGLFSFIPNLVVNSRRRARMLEVRRSLPHAADLLEICVSAGMGLDMAWNAVSDEIRHVSPALADEMALTNLEIQLGAPRPVAMRHMAERTGAKEFSTLVALLLQSERFGTSIADALRMFAGGMREDRSQRAEESAEKMSVKLLFPMVLFIFPAILIVMAGPAGIKLFQFISSGG